jgi:replicative DNA helicase
VIPEDPEAEEHIAGTCAASHCGAELAHERLSPADFYWPPALRVFQTSVRPELVRLEHDLRIRVLARLSDVDLAWLQRCVDDRPSFLDKAGASAARVRSAAMRRQIMRLAADLYERASTGDLDDLTLLVEEMAGAC